MDGFRSDCAALTALVPAGRRGITDLAFRVPTHEVREQNVYRVTPMDWPRAHSTLVELSYTWRAPAWEVLSG